MVGSTDIEELYKILNIEAQVVHISYYSGFLIAIGILGTFLIKTNYENTNNIFRLDKEIESLAQPQMF